MRRIFIASTLLVGLTHVSTSSALTINATGDGATLASALISGNGAIVIKSATYTGLADASAAYLEGPLGISNGILLTSGRALNAMPPSDASDLGFTNHQPGSSLCTALDPGTVNRDAATLTIVFDLAPGYDGISFRNILGSDEYPEMVDKVYGDIYGVFLNGTQIAFDANGDPITIDGPFFSGSNVVVAPATGTGYDGSTPFLTTRAPLAGGSTDNTLTFVICDGFDASVDSGIFLSWLGGCSGTDCTGTLRCEQIDGDGDGETSCDDCDDADPTNTSCASSICDAPAIAPPAPSTLQGLGWNMQVEVSPDDGLLVKNVKLGPRFMAQEIGLPYFNLQTSALPLTRGELTPSGTAAAARSRLVAFEMDSAGADKIFAKATYVVDRIPQGSESCMVVTQRYEFTPEDPHGDCEPSGEQLVHDHGLPCARWTPAVDYELVPTAGETMISMESAQRLRLRDDNAPGNTGTMFLDADNLFELGVPPNIIEATEKVIVEPAQPYVAVLNGQKGDWDNYHQTYFKNVEPPYTLPAAPGCPECVHIHWRWSALATDPPFAGPNGPGSPLLRHADSTQTILVTPVHAVGIEAERDPQDFRHLLNGESLTDTELAFWYSATSSRQADTFFDHGGFFSTLSGYGDLTLDLSHAFVNGRPEMTMSITNRGTAPVQSVYVNLQTSGSMTPPAMKSFDPPGGGCDVTSTSTPHFALCQFPVLAKGETRTFKFQLGSLKQDWVSVFGEISLPLGPEELNLLDNHDTEYVELSPRVDPDGSAGAAP